CIARGLPAGPGAASGKMYLNAERAVEAAAKGEKVLLVRNETSPEDLRGMIAAEGILTAKGGVSSHAALVARQMGKVCVCGDSALAFGATGIGLCRTEHMFFEGDRIDAMREMILAETKADRKKALALLLPYQKEDFIGIFKELRGLPATIRFLDPPLHEFLPHDHASQNLLAEKMGIKVERIAQRVKELHEFNPMLGFRGCRLGLVYPEISEMQSRAVFEAAAEVQKQGIKVNPEIMIPLVGFKRELDLQVEVVHRVAKEVMAEQKVKLDYLVGTMIEVPRGALTADEIAQTAQFFSFGT